MKFIKLLFLSSCIVFIFGCLSPTDEARQYVVGYVVKTAGGIDTFREPGFIESKVPMEGYEDSTAVRAVVAITYDDEGKVISLNNLRVSDKKHEAVVRLFLNTIRADNQSIDDLNGLEHDFRVWIYNDQVVHIEASR